MAIKKITTEVPFPEGAVVLNFDNGDFEVLNTIKTQWNFKDEESLLRFALAILYKSGEQAVCIKDEAGNEVTLKPSESMLNKAP
jgi:hypothetical protein